jgi:hypothetical protein
VKSTIERGGARPDRALVALIVAAVVIFAPVEIFAARAWWDVVHFLLTAAGPIWSWR